MVKNYNYIAKQNRRLVDCFIRLANLFIKKPLSLEEWIDSALAIGTSAFTHADVAVMELNLEGTLFRTAGYRKTPWRMTLPVTAKMLPLDDDNLLNLIAQTPKKRQIGLITVCYLEKRPEKYRGPFTNDECRLFNILAWYCSNVTERIWREARMDAYADKVRSMTSSVAMMEQRERHRFAEIVHDKIGQNLSLLRLQLDGVNDQAAVDEARMTLQTIIADSRELTSELCSPLLYQTGLDSALRWLADRLEERYNLKISLRMSIRQGLTEEIVVTIYQAAQELLQNVIKHSGASRTRLELSDRGGKIKLSVKDNGMGFKSQAAGQTDKGGGFGLFNLQSKLVHLGGDLKIKSGKAGSAVTVSLPCLDKMTGGS